MVEVTLLFVVLLPRLRSSVPILYLSLVMISSQHSNYNLQLEESAGKMKTLRRRHAMKVALLFVVILPRLRSSTYLNR